MQRFKPGDAVYILPKFAHLYAGSSATVLSVKLDLHRPMFNAYMVVFPDGSNATVMEFQIIENLPHYKTIVAAVVSDGRPQNAATNWRGAGSGERIVFQTEQFDLDVKIQVDKTDASLIGQILERDTDRLLKKVPVELMKEGMPVAATSSDDAGVFKFERIPRGSLNILITMPSPFVRILASFTV